MSSLKRTLSESEKDGPTVRKEGKRPKMEREELEAQLELKITAKAGSHHKLEKVGTRATGQLHPPSARPYQTCARSPPPLSDRAAAGR